MINHAEMYTPDEATEVLHNFVDQAQATRVESYQELQGIVGPEIGLAYASLIMQTGRPPKHPQSSNLAVIEHRRRFTMVRGAVGTYPNYDASEPALIELGAYQRSPIRFKRRQWALFTTQGVDNFSSATNDRGMYMPYSASDDFVGFYRDKVGTQQVYDLKKSETGLEIAGRAAR